MDHRDPEFPGYGPPLIRDYGDLLQITADSDLTFPVGMVGDGLAMSGPVLPPGDTPGPPGGGGESSSVPSGGTSVQTPAVPDVLEAPPEGEADGGDSLGDTGASSDQPGGGDGGTTLGDGTGAGSELPFTGFPVAVVGALGGALAATGAALRKRLRD